MRFMRGLNATGRSAVPSICCPIPTLLYSFSAVQPSVDWRSYRIPVVSTISPHPLSAKSRYMTIYCSCMGNAVTPVIPSPVQSATAHITKANILSNAQVASPGCTISAQDFQMSEKTQYDSAVMYGMLQGALN